MEQHPVPQNVTTFQFRLIGDMTIKQFGYLAGGAIIGYVCYKLPLPFFFTWPLAISSVCLGIGLAFVPIEERPMDVWLLSFIKSIYSPTQYLWSRQAQQQAAETQPPAAPTLVVPAPVPTAPLAAPVTAAPVATTAPQVISMKPAPSLTETLGRLFATAPKTAPTPRVVAPKPKPVAPSFRPTPPAIRPEPSTGPAVVLSQNVWDPFGFFKQLFATKPKAPRTTIIPEARLSPMTTSSAYPDIFAKTGPLPSLTGKKLDLTQPTAPQGPSVQEQKALEATAVEAQAKEKELTDKVEKLEKELTTKTTTDTRILELQKQLTDILAERGKMEQELTMLRQKLTQTARVPQAVRPVGVVPQEPVSQSRVRVITADTAVRAGLPRLTTFPNVVTGIIKDSEGNLLPSMLVTVRDKDDVPVRALKTNKLGQFAASTPLPNATFTVDIEDPRGLHFFDRIRITLNGGILAPVEITSKSKKQMERSQLEKAVFGGGQT